MMVTRGDSWLFVLFSYFYFGYSLKIGISHFANKMGPLYMTNVWKFF